MAHAFLKAYKHARLMEESESRVERAASFDSPADILVSRRILASPAEFMRWEAHHDRLMRRVSAPLRLTEQIAELRATAFTLVHRKALFEYLRDRQPRGARRRKLLAIFYGCSYYTDALLTEHGNYLRCSTSYLATRHLAEHLMHDPALDGPLSLYEEWYADYFHCFCDLALAASEEEKSACLAQESLQPMLKRRVIEARRAILAMPLNAREWNEVRIRETTGDTQELCALAIRH